MSGCSEPNPVGRMLQTVSEELELSPHGWECLPLAGDGSDRRFFRVRQGSRHYVALVSPRKKTSGLDENDSYLLIGQHLRARGVAVPEIYWADRAAGWFLLEDVGDRHLQHLVLGARSRDQLRRIYREVLRMLVRLHVRAAQGFRSDFCFDTAVYDATFIVQRELDYFRTAFLVGFLGLDVGAQELCADFEVLAAAAAASRPGLVLHRDFQSRNLMVHRGRLWLIDFQGMRFGPPVYDFAALLVDPYVMLPKGFQEELIDLYWSAAERFLGGSYREFRDHLQLVRLCRNLQVLGAYGFLGKVKGKTNFFQYIPWAWRQLQDLLDGPLSRDLPRLANLVKEVSFLPAQFLGDIQAVT
ncbi:MAG TPA: aminoglycoside phosphotransferase [Syntrophobacteraceae bacterium]|nr:aminoglycoside phosphotransferase [Syntrophobacteraceae bacterium]